MTKNNGDVKKENFVQKKKQHKKVILYIIHLPQIFYDLWYWYLILWFYDIHSKYVVKNSMEMSKVQIYSIHKTILETYYYFAEICKDCINWTLYYPMRLLE